MALTTADPYSFRSGRVSGNVTAVTYDTNHNYVSGGIPVGVAVCFDQTTGYPNDLQACGSAGAQALGIAVTAPAADQSGEITYQVRGIARCLVNGVVNPGDTVYVKDSSGRIGTAPSGGNYYVLGIAVGPASVETGDYMSVDLNINAAKTVTP